MNKNLKNKLLRLGYTGNISLEPFKLIFFRYMPRNGYCLMEKIRNVP